MRVIPLSIVALCVAACEAPPAGEGFVVRAESLVVVDSTLRYTARLAYPQITGDGSGVERANRTLADSARAVVGLYRPPEAPPPDLPSFEASAEGGFETSLLRDSLYSALLETYAYTGGAHGIHDLRGLNVDLRTGRPIVLADFFGDDTTWTDTLAARATGKLERSLGPDVLFEGRVPPDERTFRVFTLTTDSLVITFPPYAVAPYAAGPQRVAFSWTGLRPMLDPAGPARFFIGADAEAGR
jgi:hypothetical protein